MAKRDLGRIREILLYLESQETNDGWVWTRSDSFWTEPDDYQVKLAKQAGFLDGDYDTNASLVIDRLRITFLGHDYLDAVRDNAVWERTKNAVAEAGGGATLDIVKDLAVGFLKTKIEKHTGLKL